MWKPSSKRRDGRLGAVGVHAGDQAALARLLADDAHRLQHRLVARIQRRRLAHAEREVGRADVDAVQALHGQDVVQVADRLARLDHGEQQHLLVGVLPVVGAGVLGGAERPEAALAHRRIAAGAHVGFGFRLGVDHRADQPHGAGIERAHDVGGVVPGHAHQRGGVAGAHGLQHRHQVVHGGRAVLHVDGDAVPALRGVDLGREGIGDAGPAAHHLLAVGDLLLQRVVFHCCLLGSVRHPRVMSKTCLRHEGGDPRNRVAWMPTCVGMTLLLQFFRTSGLNTWLSGRRPSNMSSTFCATVLAERM